MPGYRLKPERTATDASGRKICEVFGAADDCEDFSLAWLMMPPGCRGPQHRNDFAEIVIVLSGLGRATLGGVAEEIAAGHALFVARGTVWRLENTGREPLVCYAVASPAFKPELSHPA